MMTDIFSSFDPSMSKALIPNTSLMLMINMLIILIMTTTLWSCPVRSMNMLITPQELMFSQLMRTNSKTLKGLSTIIIALFITIISINLMGMIPYTFSLSSHLIMTLTLGLPMWLSLLLSSFSSSSKKSTAHFLPNGAPDWLNPFLVLIETTSVMVRPLTLSFRLATNMTAGHIVLTLIAMYSATALFMSLSSSFILILLTTGYILFELAICLIQAYIFCLLLSLYSDDHAY